MFQNQLSSINQDFQLLLPLQKKIMLKTSLDLLIIMDTTASMGSWIAECKNKIKVIIQNLQKEFPDIKVRIGFVGYKDHSDKENLD
jgi:hypothetical protein